MIVTSSDPKKSVDGFLTNLREGDFEKALKAAFGRASEDEIENYFTEELKSESVQTTTVTKTIQTVKEDEKWKVVSNDELTDALLPGLQEAMNALS